MKEIKYICHDCKRELEEGEEFMQYEGDFIKCRKCHEIDPVLRNFQQTKMYSRIVGYIQPISAWNPGKLAEFKDRKVFKPKFDDNDVY